MKIATLIENSSVSQTFDPEHGLSLYIETGNLKILFDMGQSDAFLRNALRLGIDLSQVDFAVLSHGHYDHGGGLAAFLQVNHKAPVYLHKTAFGLHYNGVEKYIGLDSTLQENPRLIPTSGTITLAPGIVLTDCNDLHWHSNSFGLNFKDGKNFLPDDFRHEQYLQIEEGEKRILFSGCSHKGILNIAEHFCPDVLVGGFHLNKLEEPSALEAIARRLLAGNTRYYTGHCTGAKQFVVMKEIMADALQSVSTGTVIEV